MYSVPILLNLIFWTFVLLVVLGPAFLRYRDRKQVHETIRTIIAQGGEIPPELMDALKPIRSGMPRSSKLIFDGTIVTCLGVGVMMFGVILGSALWFNNIYRGATIAGPAIVGGGLILALIGVAFLLTGKRAAKHEAETF
jgi:hypothetical protein